MEEFFDCHYLDMLTLKKRTITIPKSLVLFPFKALGDFSFGMSIEVFKEHFPSIVKEFDNSGFADLGDFRVRFDNGRLSQVQVASNVKHYQIILDGVNINSQNGLKEIMSKHPYAVGGDVGRIVFPTLGIATWKNISSLYFFDESLVSLWLDFERLITQH